MKRFAIMLTLSALIFCSCGKQADFTVEEYLADWDANTSGVVQSEDGYYYIGTAPRDDMYIKTYLCYYDKLSGASGIICGRPECLHQDSDCDAYFPAGAEGLSFYDGKLYWYDNFNGGIYCCDPDLRNRKKVVSVNHNDASLEFSNHSSAFHRGYYYIWGRCQGVSDAAVQNIWKFVRISLDTGKIETLFEQAAPENIYDGISDVSFCGTHAYIAVDHADVSNDDKESVGFYILDFDLLTKESSTFCSGSDFTLLDIYATVDRDIYAVYREHDNGLKYGLAKLNSSGGFETVLQLNTDFGSYIIGSVSSDTTLTLSGGVAIAYDTDNGLELSVYDLDGELLLDGAPNVEYSLPKNFWVTSVGSDGENIYMSIHDIDNSFNDATLSVPLDGSEGFVIK